MSSAQTDRVRAITAGDELAVEAASKRLRDMYGGAVTIMVFMGSAAETIDLDDVGVDQLIDRLRTALRKSRDDYQEAHHVAS